MPSKVRLPKELSRGSPVCLEPCSSWSRRSFRLFCSFVGMNLPVSAVAGTVLTAVGPD